MPRKRLWLTYDLGIKGDYEGMYSFLDVLDALECGDSAASFYFNFVDDVISEFTIAIKEEVIFDKRSRVYVIYSKDDGSYSGRFIIGKRKPPPWAGYGTTESSEEDIGG